MHYKKDMDALVGNRSWFGEGSKLIITTRNTEVLKVHGVEHLYEVKIMDPKQSLQLFSRHAFKRDHPLDEFIKQSEKAIDIAGGLPLAIEVIGSLLFHIDKEKWDGKLRELEKVPLEVVQSKLKISYEALNFRQQHIFLDIACHFFGYDKDIVVHFWESNFIPEEAMQVLQDMSLVKIEKDNKVWMHDQLRGIGRDIVRQESKMKIEKQSSVRDPKEGLDLLRRPKGKIKVEALRLKFDRERRHYFTREDFKRLSNLRFFEVDCLKQDFCAEETLFWHESPSNVLLTNENSDLIPRLRWLSLYNIPPTFKITYFSMEDVVILDLSGSHITHDWEGWSHMKVMKNLKVLDLSFCKHLKRSPNFSAQAKLERLILCYCCELEEIDRSICHLKSLVSLDARGCESLRTLPDELSGCLTSLKYLSLRSCNLEGLPKTMGKLKSLIELDISYTIIKEIPDSIGELKILKVVKMKNVLLSKIPDAFWMIEKLEEIDVSIMQFKENLHVKIDDRIYGNKSLRILRLRWVVIKELPRLPESLVKLQLHMLDMGTFPDLSNLTNLKELDLEFAEPSDDDDDDDVKSVWLVGVLISRWIGNLSKLESLRLESFYVTTSIEELSLPPQLKSLDIISSNLRNLPRLPSSLSSLRLTLCKSLCSMEDLSNLKKLSYLEIVDVAIAEIQVLGCLENLQHLELHRLERVKELLDLSNLKKLRRLFVGECGELIAIQGVLPEPLEELKIWLCGSLQKLADPSSSNGLRKIRVDVVRN